jgi:UDP-N-acetylmuramoylalanine--D-glutamate ligase
LASEVRGAGIPVRLGAAKPSPARCDLVVTGSEPGPNAELARAFAQRGTLLVSELEVAAGLARCLYVAITGTNGRSTTAALLDAMLRADQRRAAVCGGEFRPLSAIIEETRELDFVTIAADPWQLEFTHEFRPTVAVLLNASPSWRGVYPRSEDYLRVLGRVFARQQPFDWAIVQSEALAQLRSEGLPVPGKVVTFSSATRRADLYLDRTLLVSQLPDWAGPLLDLGTTRLAAPHFAEDLLAALMAGHALKVPLETMVEAARRFEPLPGRCRWVAARHGLSFYDDHRAETPEATRQAILAMPAAPAGEPNVILIAGGRDDGADYYALGPLLARRVKHVFLLGESRERLRAAWSLFAPCSDAGTLLEAVSLAVQGAVAGDVVLWSPACFSRDHFPDHQRAGEVYQNAILALPGPGNGGPLEPDPTGGAGAGAGASPRRHANAPTPDLPRAMADGTPGATTQNAVVDSSNV